MTDVWVSDCCGAEVTDFLLDKHGCLKCGKSCFLILRSRWNMIRRQALAEVKEKLLAEFNNERKACACGEYTKYLTYSSIKNIVERVLKDLEVSK